MAYAYAYCHDCNAHHYDGKHLPVYRVGEILVGRAGIQQEPDEDDLIEVRAPSAEEAAEKYGELEDQGGDYTIVGGSPETVLVIDAHGKRSRWRVSGEAVPTYHAEEVAEDEEGGDDVRA